MKRIMITGVLISLLSTTAIYANTYTQNGKVFDEGAPVRGRATVNSNEYFCSPDGTPQNGWLLIDGNWFKTNTTNSIQKNRWDGKFYLNEFGTLLSNQWIEGGKYFINKYGEKATNIWVDKDTYVGSDGRVTTGREKDRRVQFKTFSKEEYENMAQDNYNHYYSIFEGLVQELNNERNNKVDSDGNQLYDELWLNDTLTFAANLRAVELASQQRSSGARPDGTPASSVVTDDSSFTEVVFTGKSAVEDVAEELLKQSNSTLSSREVGLGVATDSSGIKYWVFIHR